MTDQEFYQEEFIVLLTIDGTSYDEIEVKVSDPNKTIRDQINSIVQVFELPKMDNGGNPIQYLLGKLMDDDEEPAILEFEDDCAEIHVGQEFVLANETLRLFFLLLGIASV